MFYISFFISLLFLFPMRAEELPDSKPVIYVSVQPYIQIIEALVGEDATVHSIVSTSMSSHTFEPTPKMTLEISRGRLWFGIGEPFEKKLLHSIQSSLKSKIEYKNLKEAIQDDIREMVNKYPNLQKSCHCHTHDHSHTDLIDEHSHHTLQYIDPHIWMSPELMKKQIVVISNTIQQAFPKIDQKVLQTRTTCLIEKTEALLEYAQNHLLKHAGKTIITAHPAYSLLLAPYDIEQYAIEEEGKEPSPRAVTNILLLMKKEHISTIFTQSQYPSKGAEVIIQTISKAQNKKSQDLSIPHIVVLSPYSPDYFTALSYCIDAFDEALTTSTKP